MMLNRNHPDYSIYKKECDDLRDEYLQKSNDLDLELKQSHGKDGSSNQITKEFALKFKAIQRKYYYLFGPYSSNRPE